MWIEKKISQKWSFHLKLQRLFSSLWGNGSFIIIAKEGRATIKAQESGYPAGLQLKPVSVANVISKRFGEKCKFLKNVILRSSYYKYTQFQSALSQMWFQGSSAKLFWCNSNKSAWERMQPEKDKEQQWEWWPPDSFGSRNNVIHCLAGEVRPRRSRQLGLSLTKSGWLNTLERLRDNLLMGRRNRDWNSNQPLSLSYHDLEFDWESRYLKLELPPILSYQDSGWSLPAWG